MGVFDWLKSDSTKRREFAEEVIAVLERANRAGPWRYDHEAFTVKSDAGVVNLTRLYQEHQKTAASHRTAELENRVNGAFQSMPNSRDDLIKCVRPMLRDRAWLELYAIEHRRTFGKSLDQPVPHAVIGEHFAVTLVAYQPQVMGTLTTDALAGAGLSIEEAFAAAGANLRALAPGFRELKRGLWVSVEEDDFDASRLLLPQARQLDVRGAPVAVAANRNALFITGDRDEDGLEALAEIAAKELSEERSLAPLLLRLSGEWEPWMPAVESRNFATFRKWEMKATLDRYNRQKAALEALEQQVGTESIAHPLQDYFYASVQALVTPQDNWPGARTMCFWFPTPSLLPACDLLCLRADQHAPVVSVRWADAVARLPDLMKRVDGYPERWQVDHFPSEEQMQALRAIAVDQAGS